MGWIFVHSANPRATAATPAYSQPAEKTGRARCSAVTTSRPTTAGAAPRPKFCNHGCCIHFLSICAAAAASAHGIRKIPSVASNAPAKSCGSVTEKSHRNKYRTWSDIAECYSGGEILGAGPAGFPYRDPLDER
jgi:hypothetical protein